MYLYFFTKNQFLIKVLISATSATAVTITMKKIKKKNHLNDQIENHLLYMQKLRRYVKYIYLIIMQDQGNNIDPVKLEQSETTKEVVLSNVPPQLWEQCPTKARQILLAAKHGNKIHFNNVVLDNLNFEPRPTENNFCSHYFTVDVENYYVCSQCSFDDYATMCYCSSCFNPETHLGHSYYTQTPSSDSAYCDCGRLERLKKESFCSNHAKFDQVFDCEIPEEERKDFIDNLTSILDIGIFNKDSTFLEKIVAYLMKLNEKSVYYNRLTFEILEKKPKENNQDNYANLFVISRIGCDTEKLILHLGGDLKTRLNLIKLFCKCSENDNYNFCDHSSSITRELFNITAVEKLVEENYVHDFLMKVVKDQKAFKNHGSNILKKIFEIKFSSQSSLENIGQIEINDSSFFSEDFCWKILKTIIEQYPTIEEFRKLSSGEVFTSQFNPWAAYMKIDKQIQCEDNLPQYLKTCHRLAGKFLMIILLENKGQANNFRKFILSKGIDKVKLDDFLHAAIVSFKDMGYTNFDEGSLNPLIPFLLIIQDSPSQKQLVNRFWKFMLAVNEDEDDIQIHIHQQIDVLFYFIGHLYNADINFLLERKRNIRKSKGKMTYTPEEEESLKNWFKLYLLQNDIVSRDQLVHLRSEGALSFEGVGKLLNEICSYNAEDQNFSFIRSKAGNLKLNLFQYNNSRNNFSGIYTSTLRYGEEVSIEKGSLAQKLINLMLSTELVFNIIEDEWNRSLVKEDFENGEEKYAILYSFALLLLNNLSKGSNSQVRARIEELRGSEDKIASFTQNADDLEKIKKIFSIESKMEMTTQQPKSQEKPEVQESKKEDDEKKLLAQAKKLKIKEEFKKKQEMALKRVTSNDGNIGEEEELCIFCHEREKPNKQYYLVYLVSISKNNTICSAFHGKNNVANTYINSCFHAVHMKCYINIMKNTKNMQLECPLCKAKSNCIVPTNYRRENKKLNKMCKNALIAYMVSQHQIYDVETDFNMLFKHLVESKGLNSIIEENRYENRIKFWIRKDEFLFNVMEQIYQSSSKEEKTEYLADVDQFEKQINACENEVCKLIQQLFLKALKSRLIQHDSDEAFVPLLISIRKAIKEDEFLIIFQQLCRLLSRQVEMPVETEEEKSLPKGTLSFSFLQLPQKAEECIQKFRMNNCEICQSQKMESVCMLCKKVTCQNCRGAHSNDAHKSTIVYLDLGSLRVVCSRNGYYSSDDIYENDLKVPFVEKSEEEEELMDDGIHYVLNEVALQKALNKFMES